jgi:murein DD-endopeptidase MepM/ murein hydrolase activator NlpD
MVPMRPSPSTRATCLASLFLAVTAPWAASGVLPVTIEIGARSIAPGEPVRVHVVAGRSADAERWSGWTMVGLDQPPGVAVLEVSGRSRSGRAVAGTRALTIAPREFPRETLTVAPKYVEPPEEVRERLARERAKLAAIYASPTYDEPTVGPFVRPVPGPSTSVFGTRRYFNDQPRAPHSGLDLRAATGTPVVASGAGRVVLAMDLYYSGNTVIVDHGAGLFTVYAHLSEIGVREGDTIEAGGRVGLSGATGRVTGPHLHWGGKIGDRPFDPAALLDPRLFEVGQDAR